MEIPTPKSSKTKTKLNRRNFLKTGGLSLAALGGVGLSSAAKSSPAAGLASGKAKNIIFLVSDGMSAGTYALADQFTEWKKGRLSHWGRLIQSGKARFGMMETTSKNSLVTDSGAASSAWGGGHRVNNGSVNVTPDGKEPKPILAIARDAGKSTGLVTTAPVTHATPAGFAANNARRGRQRAIFEQYLERDYDLLLGGGHRFFEARGNQWGDLHAEAKAGGYHYITDRAALHQAPESDPRLIGLFADNNLPYEVDRLNGPDELHKTVPSLAEMTDAAIKRLSKNPKGFLVQIEGARVDHAAHSNDLGGLLHDQLAFDDAVGIALDFAEGRDDTLVIVTTDHGNASPGMSSGDNLGDDNFTKIDQIRSTIGVLRSHLSRDQSIPEIKSLFEKYMGQSLSENEAIFVQRYLNGNEQLPYRRMNNPNAMIGQIIANHTDIGWIGNHHTSEFVMLSAVGPGSELIQPFTRNYELFGKMVDALGMQAWRS